MLENLTCFHVAILLHRHHYTFVKMVIGLYVEAFLLLPFEFFQEFNDADRYGTGFPFPNTIATLDQSVVLLY